VEPLAAALEPLAAALESVSALMRTVGIGRLDLDLVTVQEITRLRLGLLLRWQCARNLPGDSELRGRVVP